MKHYDMALICYLLINNIPKIKDLLTRNFKDIQLAYFFLDYLETKSPTLKDSSGNYIEKEIDRKPHLKDLIQTYFIKTGVEAADPWISSIGKHYLQEHIQSVNACYKNYSISIESNELTESDHKISETWPEEFSPYLSSFHPSLTLMANLLKTTKKVKKEVEL